VSTITEEADASNAAGRASESTTAKAQPRKRQVQAMRRVNPRP
jgi:hypothetical protein